MVSSLSYVARTLAALLVRRSESSPRTLVKVVEKKLGRLVHLLKDPAVKGKLTGVALRVPTIDVSAVDPTVGIKK